MKLTIGPGTNNSCQQLRHFARVFALLVLVFAPPGPRIWPGMRTRGVELALWSWMSDTEQTSTTYSPPSYVLYKTCTAQYLLLYVYLGNNNYLQLLSRKLYCYEIYCSPTSYRRQISAIPLKGRTSGAPSKYAPPSLPTRGLGDPISAHTAAELRGVGGESAVHERAMIHDRHMEAPQSSLICGLTGRLVAEIFSGKNCNDLIPLSGQSPAVDEHW